MPEYTVRISEQAEEDLQNGILEWTAGGLRNTKTKRMAYLFRPTGNRIDERTGKIVVETVVGIEMEEDAGFPPEAKRRSTKILERLERNEKLAWEATLIAEKNYEATAQGFSEVLCRIEKLQETIDFYHRQKMEQEFREAVLNMKTVYVELIDEVSNERLFDTAKDLNKVDALLNNMIGEYIEKRRNNLYLVRMILALVILFSKCVYKYSAWYHFVGKGDPPVADEWEATIERIRSSEAIRNGCRKMHYMTLPDGDTYFIERAARLPFRRLEIMQEDSRSIRALIDSGLNLKNGYSSVGEALRQQGIAGNYITGNTIFENRYDH